MKLQSCIGMNFQEWCNLDPGDKRKINYTLLTDENGAIEKKTLTSNDSVNIDILVNIQRATISEISLIDNEWHIVLDCTPKEKTYLAKYPIAGALNFVVNAKDETDSKKMCFKLLDECMDAGIDPFFTFDGEWDMYDRIVEGNVCYVNCYEVEVEEV